MAPDLRPEAAEAIGVFLILLVGGLAQQSAHGIVAVALAWGFVVMVLVYALGHVCGAHFNPAVTLAFAVTRHFPWRRVPSYIVAQFLGATAAVVLLGALGAREILHLTPVASPGVVFVAEVLATFLLSFVIIGVATDSRASGSAAGLAIGGAVLAGILAFGSLSGAAMNPARALVPALAAGDLSRAWIYLLGPAVGAVAAMVAYEALRHGRLGIKARPLGATGPFEPGARP